MFLSPTLYNHGCITAFETSYLFMYITMLHITGNLYTGFITVKFYVFSCIFVSIETPDPPTDEFNEWGEWTTCTKTCGRGAHARRRNCLISENGTSVDCFGEKLQIRDCNAQQCLSTLLLYKCRAHAVQFYMFQASNLYIRSYNMLISVWTAHLVNSIQNSCFGLQWYNTEKSVN